MSENVVVYEVQSDISRFTKVGALIIAWFATYSLASIAQSQFVLMNLESLGIQIGANLWLEHTVLDWWGLLPKYGSAIFVALSLALLIGGKIGHWLELSSNWLFPCFGALSMLLVMMIMHPILDVTLIAGTRSFAGQLWQVLAGAAGGMLYKFLREDIARWIIQRPRQNSLL